MMEEKKFKSQQNKTRRVGLNQGSSFLDIAYKEFKNDKNNELSDTITLHMFKNIMRDLYYRIALCILDGKEVALPLGMGNILVNKKDKDGRRAIDFIETEKLGKLIYENNIHTDGYRFSIKWRKGNTRYGIQNGYQFKASRKLARELARMLKDGLGYKFQSISNRKVDKYEI